MADLDELQIQITSSSKEAEDAIDRLVKSLEGLNTSLGQLNVRKVQSFATAVAKISNAAGGLSNVADSFSKIGSVQVPDMSEAVRNVENIGKSASKTATEVEGLTAKLSKIQTVIEGRGFTMKEAAPIKNVEFPPAVINQIEAVSDVYQEKLLPAIVNTQHQADMLNQHLMNISNVEAVYDAVTQKFIEYKTQMMELNGAISGNKWIVPEFKGNADFKQFQTGWISDIQSSGFRPYFNDIEESAQKCLPAIVNVQETALALADQFKNVETYAANAFEKATSEVEKLKAATEDKGEQPLQKVVEGAEKAKSAIEKALEQIRVFKKIISDMESGKIDFNQDNYDNAIKGYDKATKAIKDYKNELLGVKKEESKSPVTTDVMAETLSSFSAAGNELKRISEMFGKLADTGTKVLKVAFIPLNHVVQEYKEKFDGLRDSISGFVKNIQAKLKKLSDFWKRTMRTFTFMVIRSAITQIIKEVGTAVQSLAMYSNAMGTAFNTDLSNMVADFQYLGRSIVSVFAPLLNYIAPIIDAITSKIATLISYIGMLFAALGGKATFTKAKKNVGNYAESLDQASKSAKNLTMGIDELNIISENKSGGSAKPYDGWEDAWEEVEIPDYIKNIADYLKDIFDKLFDPLKKAWDRAKQYVYDGFKTMVNSLKRLFGDIGKDFLEVWNQEKTIHMFEQLFKIIGDIFRVVRNLADAFDEAWNHNKTGLKILENIRDIFYILVEHARNISYYMVEWSKKVDFKPLLTAFEQLTRKAKKLADFIGGVVEDIFKYGIIKYIDFLIKDALPHLMKTISKVIDAFNFKTIRKNLQPVIVAIEEMIENIHTGVTDAIGNIGMALAKLTNSQLFADFLQRIVDITRLITAERVEKVLTALATAIIDIAEAVMRFINSDAFMKFLQSLADWVDNHSVNQIAGILENIAKVVLLFKFGEFATDKIAGFLQFIAGLIAFRNLGTIARELTELGTGARAAGEGATVLAESSSKLSGFSTVLAGVAKGLGSVLVALLEFKGVASGVETLTLALNGDEESSLVGGLGKVIASAGLATAAFSLLLGVPAGVIAAGAVGAVAAIKGINDAVEQINFDHVTDAILTQGDTTVQMVNDWYDQATEIVSSHVTDWKNIERDLVQGRGDIDAYGESIKGLSAAFESNVQLSTNLSGNLVSAYENMGDSIKNYIDTSTNSMVSNILAQREYFEAQGKDVDAMVANLLIGAENQKNTVDESVQKMNEAQQAYSDAVDQFGADSTEAEEAYKKLKTAVSEVSPVFEQFQSSVDEVDTSEAIQKINELGESLDLSEGDWEENVEKISNSIKEIKAATETGLTDVNTTYEGKIKELNEYKERNPMLSEEDYQIQLDAIQKQWDEDTKTLTDAAEKALGFYDEAFVTKLRSVADNAEKEWDESSPFKRAADKMGERNEYVYSQMENYVNEHLGESGLTGLLNDAYSVLPEHTQPSATQAMTDLVNQTAEEFSNAMGNLNVDEMGNTMVTPYQEVLDNIPNLINYQPLDDMSKMTIDSYNQGVETYAPTTETPIKTWCQNIWTWFHDSVLNFGSPSTTMIEFGQTTVESYNKGITDNAATTEAAIKSWFDTIISTINSKMNEVKTAFYTSMAKILSGDGFDYRTPIATLFNNVSTAIQEQLTVLGNLLLNDLLPAFMETYILPFFNVDMWQPLFDILLNEVFIANFETFKEWFETSMSAWWNEGLLKWFSVEKWNNELYSPLEKNREEKFKTFLSWWDKSLKLWWEEKTMPYFKVTFWNDKVYEPLRKNRESNFKKFMDWWDKSLKSWWEEKSMPYFKATFWNEKVYEPLRKNREDHYKKFIEWWDKSLKDWWDNHTMPYLKSIFWDEQIFTPLKENLQKHFDAFIEWWDESMKDWWEHHTMPYFEKQLWREQFENVHSTAEESFDRIKETIEERINEAAGAVSSACGEMSASLAEVLSLISEVMTAIQGFGDLGGSVSFNYSGEFATGGFPSAGSLFLAGETGAGAELVGNVGGKTGVVSNDEITGIADAVYSTGNQESVLLSQLISLTKQLLDKEPIVIGDKEIAEMANNGQNQLGMTILM